LVDASRRAAAKPARGGVANALFGVLPLEQAPGELVGLADALTVLLPWGSLLGAVARADAEGLRRLRGLCKPGAGVRLLFGYAACADAGTIAAERLPALGAPGMLSSLERAYRDASFAVTASRFAVGEVRALGTTWASKLAFGSAERQFVELCGRVAE
jgi:16S rRNA (adenine(1408)-N(1))-methyltransferase